MKTGDAQASLVSGSNGLEDQVFGFKVSAKVSDQVSAKISDQVSEFPVRDQNQGSVSGKVSIVSSVNSEKGSEKGSVVVDVGESQQGSSPKVTDAFVIPSDLECSLVQQGSVVVGSLISASRSGALKGFASDSSLVSDTVSARVSSEISDIISDEALASPRLGDFQVSSTILEVLGSVHLD